MSFSSYVYPCVWFTCVCVYHIWVCVLYIWVSDLAVHGMCVCECTAVFLSVYGVGSLSV